MKSTFLIFFFSIASLLFSAFAQSSRTSSSTTPKKRQTQAEWCAEQTKAHARRMQEAHDLKYLGTRAPDGRFIASISDITNNIYELPLVKKLGIKQPPRNRLKCDSFGSVQERDRANFLNKQQSFHREITSRIVNLYHRYHRYPTVLASIQRFVSDLNRVSTSSAWKRFANSNTRPLFAGEDKCFRDEISGGLSSVSGSLSNLEYSLTHNGQPNSIVQVFDDKTSSDLPAGWRLQPADRRTLKTNILSMRAENDAARDKYIQDHPEDPHAYNFIPPKAIGAGGHVITNPRLLEYNPAPPAPFLYP